VSNGRKFEIWREYPGTYTLAALWSIVYVAMLCSQYAGWTPEPDPRTFAGLGPMGIGVVSEGTGQVFGAWNTAQILSGQIWRAVTATFVHFSLVHIVLNVFGLVQLGRLIEEWYGPRLLIGLLIAVGFFGNMLAALARPVVGTPNAMTLMISSGGGSTIVFGMIGLVAVVGKRSRSRMGRYLYNQMLMLLVVNFLIGLTIPQIDNYAHAGGAIAGAILGRFHHALLGLYDHRPRICRIVAMLALGCVAAGAIGQYWVARVETELVGQFRQREKIFELGTRLPGLKDRFVKRTVLGLKGAQVIRPRGRFLLPGANNLLLPVPDEIVDRNRESLLAETNRLTALVYALGDTAITNAWKPVLAEARLAFSRPPAPGEIPEFIGKLDTFEKALEASVKTVDDTIGVTASRLTLWKTPWPNVVWTVEGPKIKSLAGPAGSRGTAARPGRTDGRTNRPTGLPPAKTRVVPRPESPPPQRGDEVGY